ncbi:ATP-binding protein [uncultured Jatrophihabitans sp.]|uniref:ATP-binding protein n=1 Tax=uncultured Jatrophihabitans sp. TaxID=1610747 RepID=UPI0035CADEFE
MPRPGASAVVRQRLVSVVIVDDSPDMRLLLRVALRRQGSFAVIGEAGDGEAGVEFARSLKPDVVLLDLAMPGMDGMHALPLIREASPNSAVVVLSAFESEQAGPAALAAGAAAYIHKGASPSDIIETIGGCLGADLDSAIPNPTDDWLAATSFDAADSVPADTGASEAAGAATSVEAPSAAGAADRCYRLLVEQGVEHPLAALDRDGRILSWNTAAARVTGLAESQALGRPFAVLYPGADAAAGLPGALLRDAAARGRAAHRRWLAGPGGAKVWGEVALRALHDDGQPAGFALTIRDETDQRRLDEAQASMFAAVSHDMRTPIIAIRAFASLVKEAEPKARAEFAERIETNAAQIEKLVTGLFDYAKVRAGVVPIVLEPLPLTPFAAECVDNLSGVLSGFQVDVQSSDAVAMADRSAMTRVLDNLLTNAAKYSPAGTRIWVTSDVADDRVRLTVHDEGRGIAAEDLEHIFGEFVRGRLAEDDGGTGLGLASVQQLLTLQGGHAVINSEVGRGTSVTVELARSS